ncbi:MAG: hypothetical protein ACJ74O_06550 [Frankiaceae bacterium]
MMIGNQRNATPQRPDLFEAARRVSLAMLDVLHGLHDSGHRFEMHQSYPIVDPEAPGDSPFTWVKTASGPPNYGSVFSLDTSWTAKVAYRDLDGFDQFLALVHADDQVTRFLGGPRLDDEMGQRFVVFGAAQLPENMAERHLHQHGWNAPDTNDLVDVYCELEHFWLHHGALASELLVPILGVSFDDDLIDLPNGWRIERMSTETQRARWPVTTQALQHAAALRAATHTLVIPGMTVGCEFSFPGFVNPLDGQYPIEQIDEFFQALAAATSGHSGYGHFVFRPHGWANGYIADLPVLLPGPVIPRYPKRLEHVTEQPQSQLTSQDTKYLRAHVSGSSDAKLPSRVRLAARRLVTATRRDDTDDSVVDLCVALEALVGDRGPGETTYKVAMRTAALLADEWKPDFTRMVVTRAYSYRSDVVHGRAPSKYAATDLDGTPQSTLELVEFVARQLLSRFLQDLSLTAEVADERMIQSLRDAPLPPAAAADETADAHPDL